MMRAVALTREEWHALRQWLDATGYSHRLPGETSEQWQARTAPIAYQYAQVIEAACDHVLSPTEPYCARCGMLMDPETCGLCGEATGPTHRCLPLTTPTREQETTE